MSIVTSFTFNPFEENTFIVTDHATKKTIIIDPGCYSVAEREELLHHIASNQLIIVGILNTHCHVDHVFGNAFLKKQFPEAPLYIHRDELLVLQTYPSFAAMYGLTAEPSPPPDKYLEDQDLFTFGETSFKVFLTPGHSPASISLYCENDQYIIGGDVLFYQSIGRTDLPGGDYETLIQSIQRYFLTLPDTVKIYCGHGQSTTIGFERRHNPFLNN
jgi:glyoxylase-like metal-dependent hydrolase (beta-lactamase superfamily II)